MIEVPSPELTDRLLNQSDEHFMALALNEARSAGALGEVPIGAVLVWQGEIIGYGYNRRESSNDPTAHAEMLAIREAAARLDSWRLLETTLYVTLEPCPMCMGAIILARIPRVVYGCRDPKAGAAGSLFDLACDERLNHRVEVFEGVLHQECSSLLSDFFRLLREQKKTGKKEQQ
jgi:tRNA(adenine34) deaminase